jgi:hypothetical protein
MERFEFVDRQVLHPIGGRLEADEVLEVVEVPVVRPLCLTPLLDAVLEPLQVGIKDGDEADPVRRNGDGGTLDGFARHLFVEGVEDRLRRMPIPAFVALRMGCFGRMFAQKDLLALELDVPATAITEPRFRLSRHDCPPLIEALRRQGGRWGRFSFVAGSVPFSTEACQDFLACRRKSFRI